MTNITPKHIGDVLNKLQHVKKRTGKSWSADCPVPGHGTATNHLSVEDAGDKCLVKCFNQHTYEDICKALEYDSLTYNRPDAISPVIPQQPVLDFTGLASKYHLALLEHTEAIDYLAARLIDEWCIDRWQLGYCPERDAISIPHMVGGKVPAIKYRFLNPDNEKRYDCETGSNLNHLFNPEQICNEMVYLCEGEFDAMVATCNSFYACSLPGGAGSFKPDFVKYFSKQRDVFLVLDADKGGQNAMEVIKGLMPGKAIVINLPDGMDVTDYFLAGYTPDTLYELEKQAWRLARSGAIHPIYNKGGSSVKVR
jgi:hypothetical protein